MSIEYVRAHLPLSYRSWTKNDRKGKKKYAFEDMVGNDIIEKR